MDLRTRTTARLSLPRAWLRWPLWTPLVLLPAALLLLLLLLLMLMLMLMLVVLLLHQARSRSQPQPRV